MSRALLVTVLLCAAVSSVRAEVSRELQAEVARRFERANDLYREGKYEDALRLFQAAYDLLPDLNILYNLGLAREKVFDYEGCALAFQQYVRDGGERVDAADARRRNCESRTRIPVAVSSWPAGAAIYVGEGAERNIAGRTPTTLDLAPGTYHLALEFPGYLAATEVVEVEAGQRPRLDFALEKMSSLRVEVDVSGAHVRIGKDAVQIAPISRELPAGDYAIVVRKPGYRTVTREVRVGAGEQLALVISLPPLPKKRSLSVDATRSAVISIDGSAPRRDRRRFHLLAGTHRVEITAPGYLPFSSDIHLPEDRDLALDVDLARKRTRRQTLALWGLAGGAGLAATGGAVFGLLSHRDEQAYLEGPTPELRERGMSRARTADYMFGTAAVLAASAAIYYLATRPGKSRARIVR